MGDGAMRHSRAESTAVIGRRVTLAGLAAAALFGASTPAAKLLVADIGALMLAGLLYLGAGAALSAIMLAGPRREEAPLRLEDLRTLAPMILAGGVVGPVLLVLGLARVSAVAASLLLNLEAPLTIALAVIAFRDHLSRREALGVAVILIGAAALGFGPGAVRADMVGVLCLVAACGAWALDNNLAQRLALRDPVAVARAKTLVAGAVTVLLAFATREPVPAMGVVLGALVIGSAGYGASIVLHLLAVRGLGAARQAALFATAPFIGAAVAVPLLGERPGARDVAAGALMAFGVWVMLRARHRHVHEHEPIEHEHRHVHDEHHQHEHAGLFAGAHSHVHRHGPLVHDHPHVPDTHHRHGH